VIPFRSKRFLLVVVVIIALVVFLLPAFVAFRYTAPEQRGQFVTHPWRGWSFAYSALAVPTHSRLKTSGMALRKADWLFKGTVVDPREVQLLFVPQDKAWTFNHTIGPRSVSTTITPRYRFIWEVRGVIDTLPKQALTTVAMMDYETGRMLYDVRDDLLPAELMAPQESASPGAAQ
jgi:hypothetical protein